MDRLAVIIGTKKAGTSSLYSYLVQHPAIAPCLHKEPKYFSHDKFWSKGWEWFEGLFDWDASQSVFGLDATTDYSHPGYAETAGRMAGCGKDIRVIYIMRDPIEKIESLHFQFLADGVIDKNIREQIDPVIKESALYSRFIGEYSEALGRDKVLLIKFDDLKMNSSAVLDRITDYLGLDRFDFDVSVRHNEKSSVIGQSLGWWKKLRSIWLLKRMFRFLPLSIKDDIRRLIGKASRKAIPDEQWKLTEGGRKALWADLQEEMATLRNNYGFDVSGWGPKSSSD
jgi:hypothetical protein